MYKIYTYFGQKATTNKLNILKKADPAGSALFYQQLADRDFLHTHELVTRSDANQENALASKLGKINVLGHTTEGFAVKELAVHIEHAEHLGIGNSGGHAERGVVFSFLCF